MCWRLGSQSGITIGRSLIFRRRVLRSLGVWLPRELWDFDLILFVFCHQVSSSALMCISTKSYCLAAGLTATGPTDHGLEPLKPSAKQTFVLYKLIILSICYSVRKVTDTLLYYTILSKHQLAQYQLLPFTEYLISADTFSSIICNPDQKRISVK